MPDTLNEDERESGSDLEPADAFAALGNPIRVEILRAFLERAQAEGESAEPVVRFSTLRKTVGIRDSGQFRYHLEQLRGQFIEKCDGDGADAGGYRLTYAGSEVINAIIAGTYTDSERRGPAALESACGRCGTAARASYRDGVLEVTCENDHPLFLWALPPNAAADASLEEIVDLATTLAVQSYELVADGTCSECYSPVEPGIRLLEGCDTETDTDDDATPTTVDGRSVRFTARCDACGAGWDAPVGFVLFTHPRVESLYHRRGRPIRSQYWWDLEVVSGDGEVAILEADDEPQRVRLTVDVGDAQVRATIDDTAQVVALEIDRSATDE
ncbi:DUF7351 domain-containing protein [Halopiger xanaduensis]|uniref:ArsR family transcriptional regulator n=1 Tax=Halopiger xanaduensis (strain DSM 18323 / JCM 14033 / SH-6) TaxID=797210 RepID=F8D423_HALXS|nr:helix-turn-helix transcriptional regulator [Halopiger xanaduensis]AEH36278.1 hypothetical protein Halxa_1646 [Halopiger xanaduensis SH-6]